MAAQNHIVIIGGTACGPKTAARARRCDPTAKITLIERRDNLSIATCGLPYFISGVIEERKTMITREPGYFRNVFNMDVLTGTEATAIDPRAHTVTCHDLKTGAESMLSYTKLVLATGAKPVVRDWEGRDLAGIFTLNGLEDADYVLEYAACHEVKNVVVVGAGLIGLEMVEAFSEMKLNVTVIEALDRVLPALLDPGIAALVEAKLKENGVTVHCNCPATGFLGTGSGRVRAVCTGVEDIPADLVLLALGVRPEVTLARDAGIVIGSTGGIAVDGHLHTSMPDIYAGGDCAEVTHLVTGQKFLAPMGSTANKHGRIIGTNVTGGSDTFPGVLGTAIAKVFDMNAGRTGCLESQARDAGYDVVTTLIPGFEHATYYPGARDVLIKLIADRATGRLLGAQGVGTGDIAKRIDVFVTALTFGATVESVANLDLAYAPPFSSAMDPVHGAVNTIRNKRTGLARGLTPAEVRGILESSTPCFLLDVRSEEEWKKERLQDVTATLIPLPQLRKKLDEIPRDRRIIIFCRTSIRAYLAQRILEGAGLTDVWFLDGSTAAWPYGVDTTPR